MKDRMQNLIVMMEHRERVVKAKDFEEFKVVQVALLDYLIATMEADDRRESAVEEYMAGPVQILVKTAVIDEDGDNQ